eukprot:jgi/Chlat1/7814/Chrsp66S09170
MEPSTYSDDILVNKLKELSSTQNSIASLSGWCLNFRDKAKRIVTIWENEFKTASDKKKLAFVYLANDIVQTSRKHGPEFISPFWSILPRALKHLLRHGDQKIEQTLQRMLKIWEERRVFGSSAINNLRAELFEGRIGSLASPKSPRSPHSPKSPTPSLLRKDSSELHDLGHLLATLRDETELDRGNRGEIDELIDTNMLGEDAIEFAAESGQLGVLGQELAGLEKKLKAHMARLEATQRRRTSVLIALRSEVANQERDLDKTKDDLKACESELSGIDAQRSRLAASSNAAQPSSHSAGTVSTDSAHRLERVPSVNSVPVRDPSRDPRKAAAAAAASPTIPEAVAVTAAAPAGAVAAAAVATAAAPANGADEIADQLVSSSTSAELLTSLLSQLGGQADVVAQFLNNEPSVHEPAEKRQRTSVDDTSGFGGMPGVEHTTSVQHIQHQPPENGHPSMSMPPDSAPPGFGQAYQPFGHVAQRQNFY